MAVWLEWVGTGRGFPLPLGRPAMIGRWQKSEVFLPARHISRNHCQALWDGCRVWVYDLGGSGGTSINGVVLRDGGGLLRLGDLLHVGPVPLRLGTPSRVEATWLAWQGGLVGAMARQADESGDFGGLPVLADALEEAGCNDAALLDHLHHPGPHVRGCWPVDLLTGRR